MPRAPSCSARARCGATPPWRGSNQPQSARARWRPRRYARGNDGNYRYAGWRASTKYTSVPMYIAVRRRDVAAADLTRPLGVRPTHLRVRDVAVVLPGDVDVLELL